ncbi:SAM-dependent methyltransferase [Streptomyces sp. HPF1205]|uniref:SAM-dependent methyltransferase n=1 Tax=Streptomyces sp. HPF1205 TaxID=2873262 RepID=UPI001CEC8887|nr:SAM-dependent methyltransferase [Streptomyces sp. HPF1205]
MERALYGPGGFFLRESPAAHFRTSVHASPLFAAAVARLLLRVDDALGRPGPLDFVDMAAGRGELSAAVLAAVGPGPAARLRVFAVERAPRPGGLDPRVTWTARPPAGVRGLLLANEWLDNVPLDVARAGRDGTPRYVLVRPDGGERLGGRLDPRDEEWLSRWWQAPAGGAWRAEIGASRDDAWGRALGHVREGLAVAVDYGHTAAARPPYGTLTGYRAGRQVAPVPDGSCDLTAHVALDSLPGGGALVPQRDALRALGLSAARPPLALATTDPAAYVRALSAASHAAELTDPSGLGSFTWVATPMGAACAGLLGGST